MGCGTSLERQADLELGGDPYENMELQQNQAQISLSPSGVGKHNELQSQFHESIHESGSYYQRQKDDLEKSINRLSSVLNDMRNSLE